MKLLRHGKGWLDTHPECDTIAWRYLKHNSRLTQTALLRLTPSPSPQEESVKPQPLREQRMQGVLNVLKEHNVQRVLDLGCGEGELLRRLLPDPQFTELVGLDISPSALEKAKERLDAMPERQARPVQLLHGSLTYRDRRLEGYDAACVIEVIEHIDPALLAYFEQALFGYARPRIVVLTTPNREYNRLFGSLDPSAFRHPDHRFEWTRQQFSQWTEKTASRFGYHVKIQGVGPDDSTLGTPTQMGVFQRYDL